MNYTVTTMDNGKFTITEEEYKGVINAKDIIFFSSCNQLVRKNAIIRIYPNDETNILLEKRKQTIGILHDGTMVKKYFGQWIDASTSTVDDNGNYKPVIIDQVYYPEIAKDCVPTVEEFEKIKNLPIKERLEKILCGKEPKRLSERFNKIKEIINQK